MKDPKATPAHFWTHTLGSGVLGLLCLASLALGMFAQILTLVVALLLIAGLISRLVGWRRGTNELGLLRSPWAPELRWYRIQLAVRVCFVGAWLLAAKQNVDLLAVFAPGYLAVTWGILAAMALAFVGLSVVPRARISASSNLAFLLGALLVFGLWGQPLASSGRAAVAIESPFRGESFVFQGGDGLLINHHYLLKSQRYALDLVVLKQGRLSVKEPKELSDYYAFNAPLYAPVSGKVLKVVQDLPDQKIGTTNWRKPAGNHIVIAMSDGRYLMMAHLKKGSVLVKEGAVVKVGQKLASCGNSGNTTMPHLHIQVQSKASFLAKGVKTYPISLRGVRHLRGGQALGKGQRLRRGDLLVSAK